MDTTNYENILPRPGCDPQDALEAISEKMPGYIRDGLFQTNDFVRIFASRFQCILATLPKDTDPSQDMQVNLAHIMYGLYINHGGALVRNIQSSELNTMNLLLDEESELDKYLPRGEDTLVDTLEPRLFTKFLDELYKHLSGGIGNAIAYIRACIRISQLDGGMTILQCHLGGIYTNFGEESLDIKMEEDSEYGEGEAMDPEELSLQEIISLHQMTQKQTLPLENTREAFRNLQRERAGIHIYLDELFAVYIEPQIHTLRGKKYNGPRVLAMLNNLHDILDTDNAVPVFFKTKNIIENRERMEILGMKKNIH